MRFPQLSCLSPSDVIDVRAFVLQPVKNSIARGDSPNEDEKNRCENQSPVLHEYRSRVVVKGEPEKRTKDCKCQNRLCGGNWVLEHRRCKTMLLPLGPASNLSS